MVQALAKERYHEFGWSGQFFAAAVVVIGMAVEVVMHLIERKKPKYVD